MRKYLIVLLTALSMVSTAFSEEASDHSIRELMEITGAGNIGVQAMSQMIPSFKKMVPDAPASFWDDFMNEVDANDLVEIIIPIYKKYLTQEDVIALNEFYNSPVGIKLIKLQPSIMQESMIAGQAWGEELAQKVLDKYNAQKQESSN